MSLATLGAIAGGINRGMDMTQRDREIEDSRRYREEDREFQRSQREFQSGQQQRTLDEQARADQLRTDLSGVTPIGGDVYGAGDEGPTKKTQTAINQARQQAAAYQKAGDSKAAGELWRWADEAASKKAAQSWLQNLNALPRDASLRQIAEVAAAGVDADESPIGVDYKNIRENPDGSVSLRLFNKTSGVSQEQTFKSVGDLKEALTWHYAPDYAKSMYEKRLEAEQELNKNPVASVPDGYYDKRSGQFIRTRAAGDVIIGYNADGEPIYGKGAGSGSSKGGKAADPVQAAADAVLEQATKGEIKLQPTQLSDAQLRAAQIASRGVPLYAAANVAIKVAQDPNLLKPRFDPKTGFIDNVFEDQALGEVVVDRQIASGTKPNGLKTEQLKGFANQAVQSINPQTRPQVVKAAFDGKVRGEVENGIRAEINKAYEQRIAANPNAKQALEAERDATIKSSLDALGRKLDLIHNHYPKPADEASPARRSFTGGLRGGEKYVPPPDSPAGKARARDEAIQRQRSEAEAARQARAPEVAARAKQIVSAKDLRAADELQKSKDFDLLTREQKLDIYKLVNGIQR